MTKSASPPVSGDETQDDLGPIATIRRPGRPRRPDTEQRAYRAALQVFGERGWSSLSLDSITTLAKLGKSSIYLRWESKTEILAEALRSLDADIVPESVSAHLSLMELCMHAALNRIAQYRSPSTRSLLRLQQEVTIYPDIFIDIWHDTLGASSKRLVQHLDAATQREGRAGLDTGRLSHCIEAAALFCATFGTVVSGPDLNKSDRDCIDQMIGPHLA